MKDESRDSASPLLQIKDLSQAYFHKRVLRQINLSLKNAETISLLGQNGTGKTTLLKVIAGFLKPQSGTISFGPHFMRTSLFLPDGFLYEDLTLKENLNIYAQLCGTPRPWQEYLLQILNLGDFVDNQVRNLSRGQKVRGGLCRAFLLDASLYLLDEPMTGLDIESSQSLLTLLKKMRELNKTVLLSTHNPERLVGTATRWIRLSKGKIISDGGVYE